MAVTWATREEYFIRSTCLHYNVSKSFNGKEWLYTAWYTERPDRSGGKFKRDSPAVIIGEIHTDAKAAIAECERHQAARQ